MLRLLSRTVFLFALVAPALTWACHSVGHNGLPSQSPPTVPDIVKAVQTALDHVAADKVSSQLPPLSRIKIILQTVQDSKFSVGANFLVISLKGYDENSVTRSLELDLTPEPTGAEAAFATPTLAAELEKAIRSACDQVAASYPSSTKAPALKTDEVDLQIGFAVVKGGSAGASWTLTPISPSLGGEVSNKTTHTITLIFAKPAKS